MNILITILIIGVIIFIHEFGHFIAAKLLGIEVVTFSLGFGKSLYSYTYKDTDYRVSLIPFGGYVLMPLLGEAAWWKKFIIALMGPLSNLIVFCMVLIVAFLVQGASFSQSIQFTGDMFYSVFTQIGEKLHLITIKDFSGPIGMVHAAAVDHIVTWQSYVNKFLSIDFSIALLNLLPIPPLDGYHMIAACFEPFINKKSYRYINEAALIIGAVVFVVFLLAISFNDIKGFF